MATLEVSEQEILALLTGVNNRYRSQCKYVAKAPTPEIRAERVARIHLLRTVKDKLEAALEHPLPPELQHRRQRDRVRPGSRADESGVTPAR